MPQLKGIEELLSGAKDAFTVRRVFGEPIEKDGVTVIPVANIRGGGGGGGGSAPDGDKVSEGFGGGFGIDATPAGVYIIKNGEVSWQPALNVNRIIGGALATLTAMVWARAAIKRAKRGPKTA